MGDELRDRFFTPFVLPLAVIGVMLLFGISLARIFLAVSELGAAFVAILAAGYIMAMAFFVEARKRITARALGVALAIGLIGLMGAGAVASAAGMRELEHHGEGEGEHGGEGEGEGGEAAASEPVFVAIDIAYESAPAELPAGEEIEVQLVNEGAILHNVLIEERGDELILEAEAGETDSAAITLEAGEYTYYCDVPGHRSAGMEGTLTAAEGVEVGGGADEEAAPGAEEEGATAESASEGIGEPSELGS